MAVNSTKVEGKLFYNCSFGRGERIASTASMRRAAARYMKMANADCAYYESWIQNNRWHFEPVGKF